MKIEAIWTLNTNNFFKWFIFVKPVETPEDEAESDIWIEAEDDLSGRIQLACEFDRSTQRGDTRVRESHRGEHSNRRHAKVQIAERVTTSRSMPSSHRLLLATASATTATRGWEGRVDLDKRGPMGDVDHLSGLLAAEELANGGQWDECSHTAHLDYEPDGGQRGGDVLVVRRSDGDGHETGVEASVEADDQIGARCEDERHVVAGDQLRLVEEHGGDALGPLVQLSARERLGLLGARVQHCVEHVVGACGGTPPEDVRDELVLASAGADLICWILDVATARLG